jgi:hypothetical protein
MVFWSGYARCARDADFKVFFIWIKRARCSACGVSHALLPSFCLLGRLDVVEVIGPAVSAVLDGRPVTELVAVQSGVPATTVRGWCRRHRQTAQDLLLTLVAVAGMGRRTVDDMAGPSEVAALRALTALGSVLSAHLGVQVWPAVSVLCGGAWLSVTTHSRWESGARKRLMVLMTGQASP